jgi:hypothetical protein
VKYLAIALLPFVLAILASVLATGALALSAVFALRITFGLFKEFIK